MQPFTFDRPDDVLQANFADHGGETAIVIVGGHHEAVTTKFGSKPATRYSMVILTGRHANKPVTDGLAFGNVQSQLASKAPGAVILVRIKKDDRSVTLEAAGGYDTDLAMAWARANPGAVEFLQREAVDNFHTKAREIAAGNTNGGNGYSQQQAPLQHWSPPTEQQPAPQPGWTQQAQQAMAPLPQPGYAAAPVPTPQPEPQVGYPMAPAPEQQPQVPAQGQAPAPDPAGTSPWATPAPGPHAVGQPPLQWPTQPPSQPDQPPF